jgi:hypothetical protein
MGNTRLRLRPTATSSEVRSRWPRGALAASVLVLGSLALCVSGDNATFPAVTSTTLSLVVDRQTGSGQPAITKARLHKY